MRCISIVALLAIGVACGSDRAAFRPTEDLTTSARSERPAASYDIRAAHDQPAHVRVNVWSRGAWVEDGRTLARVAIEVVNSGEAPVRLETSALRLDAYRNTGAQLPSGELVSNADLSVPPNETGSVRLEFELLYVRPDDIASMRLRWALQYDDGGWHYVQFTDFRRVGEYVAGGVVFYDPIWGDYDPFLYGPPYGHHFHYRVPIGRVIIGDRGTRTTVRDR
jgi:hypothetical protein